jgi:hypothetical protein
MSITVTPAEDLPGVFEGIAVVAMGFLIAFFWSSRQWIAPHGRV